MKNIAFVILFLSSSLFSQKLSKVENVINAYPKMATIEELASKIDKDFKSEFDKVKAIYTWLALNIDYDLGNPRLLKAPEVYFYTTEENLERRKKSINKLLVLNVFETRKAICKGYALTFKKICDILKIENEVIKGYVKTSPFDIMFIPKNKNHIWNAIKINNKWRYLDVTFGAGYISNFRWHRKLEPFYFDIKEEDLNLSYYPSEKKWINTLDQNTLEVFSNKPIYNTPYFSSKAKLISPLVGKITTQKKKKITLKLLGLKPDTKILYFYSKENIYKEAFYKNRTSYSEIVLRSPKEDSNLNIYFNNELALQYKVVVK